MLCQLVTLLIRTDFLNVQKVKSSDARGLGAWCGATKLHGMMTKDKVMKSPERVVQRHLSFHVHDA